jgi:hypothetical protein
MYRLIEDECGHAVAQLALGEANEHFERMRPSTTTTTRQPQMAMNDTQGVHMLGNSTKRKLRTFDMNHSPATFMNLYCLVTIFIAGAILRDLS